MRTADHLQHALVQFLGLAVESEDRMNELNIFPIADGDTGTNVVSTLEAIVEQACSSPDLNLAAVANRVGSAALGRSRGNSGLILGQFLTGFSRSLVEDPWPEEWVEAIRAGAEAARRSVSEPAEGTILTVADAAASAMGDTVPLALANASTLADSAVVKTEFQLEVLTKAGVVDAGGVALALFFRSLADVVANEPEFTIVDRVEARPARRRGDSTAPEAHKLVGYELQFNCRGSSVDHVRALLNAYGTDVVVGVDSDVIGAHVHAERIGPVIEATLGLDPFNIRVEALLEVAGPVAEQGAGDGPERSGDEQRVAGSALGSQA